ncbi:SdpI family protein [Phenylobacterium sp.]|uniref:SdpI family protein n=1 Tax=Phenylobacterium sp. TaxID=1871053 RepID=UPI0035656B4D
MRLSNATWIASSLIAGSVAVAAWAWFMLPAGAGVPVNYLGLDGVRHHGVSRQALWLIPVISGLVATSMTFAPRFGMQREVERAGEVFDITLIAVAGLLLVVQVALVGRALDPDFNVMRPVAIATGVLLLAVGNYLGKARQNWFIGLKTPWTLADAGVWDKTHRFTGRGLFLGGLTLIVLGFAFHEAVVLGLAIGACTALPMLMGVARSRSLYRRLQHR